MQSHKVELVKLSLNEFISRGNENTLPTEGVSLRTFNSIKNINTVEVLANLLKSGKCPDDTEITLQWESALTDESVEYLTDALQHKNCPKKLKLYVRSENITDKGIKKFAEALKTEKCQPGLDLTLAFTNTTNEGANSFASVVQNENCPNLRLSLIIKVNNNFIDLKEITTALKQQPRSSRVTIGVIYPRPTPFQIVNLADEIANGFFPPNSTFEFLGTVDDNSVQIIASALQSSLCSFGVKFKFSVKSITAVGVKHLADVLQHVNCPQDLELDLSMNQIGDEGAGYIAKALEKNQKVKVINVSNCGINEGAIVALVNSLKFNTSIIDFNVQFNLSTNFDYKHETIVRYCCFRNKLILQYPEHESFILKISEQHGMYLPGSRKRSVSSLKNSVGSFIFFNKAKFSTNSISQLPEEIQNFIKTYSSIEKELSLAKIPPLMPDVSINRQHLAYGSKI